MREPAGKFWLERLAEIGADVEIGHAGSAAEPLEDASATEIDIESLDVNRDAAE